MAMGTVGKNGLRVVLLIAAVRFLFHALTNGAYGFHRDELALIDDSRFLDWGYVAYPPIAPMMARVVTDLFGVSTMAIRTIGALAQSLIMILVALIARRMGGGSNAQILAAVAVAISPMSMIMTSLYQYTTLDALWWVVVAWAIASLISSADSRWWLVIGTAIGAGMMTRYTMGYWVVALVCGVLLTDLRHEMKSRWLWIGAILSLLIWLPNLIWQIQHDFVSFEFLSTIHARDVEWGRTDGFFIQQMFVTTSAVTVPLWIAGLWFFFRSPDGRRFRILGWMFLIAAFLMVISSARAYYLTAAYSVLFAGGGVVVERWLRSLTSVRRRVVVVAISVALIAGASLSAMLMLPLAPVGSPVWKLSSKVHDNFREEIGWVDLVETVERVWSALPAREREATAIFVSNYGQAGAINLYGPELGLPTAISGVNSYWYRGYPEREIRTVILLGATLDEAEGYAENCASVARIGNRFGVSNEESTEPNEVIVCRGLRVSLPEIWPELQSFG